MKTHHPFIPSLVTMGLLISLAAPAVAQKPVITAPGDVTTARRPTIEWTQPPGAIWYHVWLSVETAQGADDYGAYYAHEWTQQTSWRPDWDLPAGHYTVWVRSWGSTAEGEWSEGKSFDRTNPEMISSINGVMNDGGNVELVAGTNVSIVSDDTNKTITISSATSSAYTAAEPLNVTPGRVIGLNAASLDGDVLTWNASSNHWMAARPNHLTTTTGTRNNVQPFQAVNFIIATQGTFPSRNAADPFLAEIIMFGGNFAPRGWALCNGQLLPIDQNQALFSLLGTTYGGDGRTTFGLPEMRGRVPVHAGSGPGLTPRGLGEKGGSENAHTH